MRDVSTIHMSPRWGLDLGSVAFLHTCRPAGAWSKRLAIFYTQLLKKIRKNPKRDENNHAYLKVATWVIITQVAANEFWRFCNVIQGTEM